MNQRLALKIYALLVVCLGIPFLKAASESHRHTPDTTEIIFDIDGVILKKGTKKNIELGAVIKAALKSIKNPSLLKRSISLWRKGAASEEWEALFAKYGRTDLVAMVHRVSRAKVPIDGTVAIIKELKARGYTIRIASNMGQRDFDFYKERYKDLFALFDDAFVIDYETNEEPAKKPDPRYFSRFRTRRSSTKHYRILVDDHKANCDAFINARTATDSDGSADAIVFNNPDQFRAELKRREILS